MKKTANIWEYKVGIKAVIANFLCMWKSRLFKGSQYTLKVPSPILGWQVLRFTWQFPKVLTHLHDVDFS